MGTDRDAETVVVPAVVIDGTATAGAGRVAAGAVGGVRAGELTVGDSGTSVSVVGSVMVEPGVGLAGTEVAGDSRMVAGGTPRRGSAPSVWQDASNSSKARLALAASRWRGWGVDERT